MTERASTETDNGDGERPKPRKRLRRTRRVALILVAVLLVLGGGAAGGLYLISENLAGNVERVPSVFDELDPDERPEPAEGVDEGARTFLLAGIDSRSTEPTTGEEATGSSALDGGARSDAIVLVRLEADGESATAVSIPRDSWVPVPGYGHTKINAAYAHGGPALLVHTLEELTDVRIDHFAVIDFAGFEGMTDAVGGIEVEVESATSYKGVEFEAGVNHLDGEEALAYVRQRKDLPQGDLDRVRRHQRALRALLGEAVSGETMRSPTRAYELLDTVSRWVSVDDTLTNSRLRSLVLELRSLRSHDMTFLTAPVTGTGREGEQSVVYLNEQRGPRLWSALREGRIESYANANPEDVLDGVP
ncbi:transcriptional attenuator, LytR family [Haloechinothrix alba]|uniref:Transcriptional attenuator, LytR family n=1 Tax=Haloechinothrix alba TaxID=664784 RepID=A0A238UZU8_9PSEU|nr:LCP family protein [Haloechinothrix alba]SNR27451.1 transcriptional attenuator, LytR family [Haloechinothrix alba]